VKDLEIENLGEFFEVPLWRQVWEQNLTYIIIFSVFLPLIILAMTFKDRLAKSRTMLNIIRYGILGVSFVYVGLILKAQPTTTNIIIILNSLKELHFPLGLFLMEPYIFLSFVFILITLLMWGRGVFCGWLCPYGAMLELLYKLYEWIFPKFSQKLRWSLPERVHWRLVYLKYLIFLVILGVSFYSFILSEYLTEIEPFRTFVLKLNRQWHFVLYFVILSIGSFIIYRAFCRYICPLGAALAVPSLFKRIPLIRLKRYDFCGTCKICARTCRPQAILSNGLINNRECLNCLDCQINFWDEDVCPVLIRQKKFEGQGSGGRGQEKKGQEGKVPIAHSPLSIALIGLTILFSLPSMVYAKTLTVGVDYKTIGDALKVAKDGDLIEVGEGEYREKLKIQKAVHLKGVNNPVISVQDGNIIEITRPGVIFEGFTLKYEGSAIASSSAGIYIAKGSDGAIVRNNNLLNVMYGVFSVSSRGIKIENNIIEGRKKLDINYRGNCINLTDTQEAHIIGNKLSNCRDGIYMEVSHDTKVVGNDITKSRYAMHTMWVDRGVFNKNVAYDNHVGIAIMYSKQSEVKDNVTCGNKTSGLLLIQALRSQISGNVIIGNTKGLFFYSSLYNMVLSNLIMNNNLGLHNWGGSEENSVNGNSFISNEVQVKYIASRKGQEWNNNYWSDYIGWDMTGDGIGDTPYESSSVIDHIFWRYPLAKVMFTSPSLQLLWMLERQFPLLKVPKVVDNKPSMVPLQKNWKELKAKYPYTPERYYGDIEKIQIVH